uniref:DNAJC9 HTH domain-containing protein n=1 Tax=Cyclophora tenuis TaxID=216820 RepID=A0A7S1D862_CYCTE|mmetsp:Transcript_3717/g.6355  ORF Transcript_3717/g.6355 Transcript_3717/m.6355 type:complete len:259 (+) Transcript_3717:1-777(+)
MKSYFSQVFGNVTTDKINRFAEKYKCSDEEEQDVLKYYQQCRGNLKRMLDNVMLSSERDAQRWVEDFILPAVESGSVPDYTKALNKSLKKCLQTIDEEEELEQEQEEEEENQQGNQHEKVKQKARQQTKQKQKTKQQATKKAKQQTQTKPKPKTPVLDDDATESEDSDVARPKPKKRNKKAAANKKTKAKREAEEAEALLAKIQGKKSMVKRKKGFDSMLSGLASKYGGGNVEDPLDDAEFERIQNGLKKRKKKDMTY